MHFHKIISKKITEREAYYIIMLVYEWKRLCNFVTKKLVIQSDYVEKLTWLEKYK